MNHVAVTVKLNQQMLPKKFAFDEIKRLFKLEAPDIDESYGAIPTGEGQRGGKDEYVVQINAVVAMALLESKHPNVLSVTEDHARDADYTHCKIEDDDVKSELGVPYAFRNTDHVTRALRNIFKGSAEDPIARIVIEEDQKGFYTKYHLKRVPTEAEEKKLPRQHKYLRVKYQVLGSPEPEDAPFKKTLMVKGILREAFDKIENTPVNGIGIGGMDEKGYHINVRLARLPTQAERKAMPNTMHGVRVDYRVIKGFKKS